MKLPKLIARGGLLRQLHAQVLAAVIVGILIGFLYPRYGVALQPMGTAFIGLVRLLLAPVVFCTIVTGLARMGNLKEAGRIGLKALIYFEVVSTLALGIGLVVVNVVKPGAGMNADPQKLAAQLPAAYAKSAPVGSGVANALMQNPMLQVIAAAIVCGVLLALLRAKGRKMVNIVDAASHGLFFAVGIVMRAAPLGALGGVAFTVGEFGAGGLGPLVRLLFALYATSLIFVFVVLGFIAHRCGLRIWKILHYIREEIVIVFATVSTEAVLPRLMEKLEKLGCAKQVVGLVLPAGYTFNPDGTAVYLTMASVFIAQATNTPLSIGDQLFVLAVLLLTSKGSAGVAGGGFVALAATLASLGKIPVGGLVLLLGVDRFMNEARAVTNLIGNTVATIAVASWEGELDKHRAKTMLDTKTTEQTKNG